MSIIVRKFPEVKVYAERPAKYRLAEGKNCALGEPDA